LLQAFYLGDNTEVRVARAPLPARHRGCCLQSNLD
jgi:hypothetical protein